MAGMYTKMTATGSSLIVAPRTISKELETKIASSIGSFIAEHGVAKLATKKVRQFVEKEVHVSLANHKEVLKRLMLQEFRKNKAEKAAKRVVPQPWKITARRQAIMKGLHCTYALLQDSELALELSLGAMLELSELQHVDDAEITRVALVYTRMIAASWLQRSSALRWPEERVPTADEVMQLLIDVYAVERIGISHPHRTELLEFLDRIPPVHSTTDYFGWDPTRSLPSSVESGSIYSLVTDAILKLWFAHALNVSLGCTFPQLLQHLPMLYPYKSQNELSEREYRDQVYMIATLVLVLTDFGKLKCEPELLVHEYSFLRQHLVRHIVRQDLPLVGQMLRALRCFIGADNLISVRRSTALVLLSQQADGSWKTISGSHPRDTYHCTTRCLFALCEMPAQGYAPSISSATQMLELNMNADLPGRVLEDDKTKERRAPTGSTGDNSEHVAATTASTSTSSPLQNDSPEASVSTTEESIENQVRFHQSLLEKAGDSVKDVSAALATQVLTTLASVQLNVDILKSTGIGRTINKLRKHGNEDVAKAATQLVAKWKKDLL